MKSTKKIIVMPRKHGKSQIRTIDDMLNHYYPELYMKKPEKHIHVKKVVL